MAITSGSKPMFKHGILLEGATAEVGGHGLEPKTQTTQQREAVERKRKNTNRMSIG